MERRRYIYFVGATQESRSDESSRWTIAETDFLPGNRIRRLPAQREFERVRHEGRWAVNMFRERRVSIFCGGGLSRPPRLQVNIDVVLWTTVQARCSTSGSIESRVLRINHRASRLVTWARLRCLQAPSISNVTLNGIESTPLLLCEL